MGGELTSGEEAELYEIGRELGFGVDEIEDVVAAYRMLAGLPYVDKTRVAVIGGSHGGYLAQMLATRERPAATVKAQLTSPSSVTGGTMWTATMPSSASPRAASMPSTKSAGA